MPRWIVLAGCLLLSLSAAAAETTPSSEYAARRRRLAEAIGPKGMFIAFSSAPAVRNGDVEWPYRQNDDLFYLTGVTQPDTTLVLLPGDPGLSEVLFAPERNPRRELWTGKIPSADELRETSGIKTVVSPQRFDSFVRSALLGGTWAASPAPGPYNDPTAPAFANTVRRGEAEIWLLMGRRPADAGELGRELEYAQTLRERHPELRFRDATHLLRDMREIKTPAELALLRRAVDITGDAQLAAMRRAQTATNEKEIDTAIELTYRQGGACCWGFPSIVGAGANATTLHYVSNDAPIRRGDLVLTDLGADYQGYTADITRTYPTTGRFTPDQRVIHDAVFRAQEEAIRAARPGRTWRELYEMSQRVVGETLLQLGLITRNEPEQVRLYYPHSLGHHVGLQVHDTGSYQALKPGMVIAVEPGIYVRKDDVLASSFYGKLNEEEKARVSAALDRFQGIGVRIEDNVLITATGAELLSGKAPRSAADIEAFLESR